MPKKLEFFYDCSSPWTYLAFTKIEDLAQRRDGRRVVAPHVAMQLRDRTQQRAPLGRIEAMIERTMCQECGKLQKGPGRADEPRCGCPF